MTWGRVMWGKPFGRGAFARQDTLLLPPLRPPHNLGFTAGSTQRTQAARVSYTVSFKKPRRTLGGSATCGLASGHPPSANMRRQREA